MPHARHSDPDTSHEAARRVRHDTVKWMKEGIIWALEDNPLGLTDEQLFRSLSAHPVRFPSPSSLRTRRSELVDEGIVEAVPDKYGETASGRKCHIWRLKPEQRLF